MSLGITIDINGVPIQRFLAVRKEATGYGDEHRYETSAGDVNHYYQDGAVALALEVLRGIQLQVDDYISAPVGTEATGKSGTTYIKEVSGMWRSGHYTATSAEVWQVCQ